MSTPDGEERRISPFLQTLSSSLIADAVKHSPDNGVTIVLSRLDISSIGPEEAEELSVAVKKRDQEDASTIERLTLDHNRLTTLPLEFELFTRLRYLNLKHNFISTFPSTLTQLLCLDVLDISHNKIRSLPSHPGNLTRLRVFCLSRNKITRLPSYLSQFHQLDVLQIDRNPIEWPPRSIMETFGDSRDVHKSKDWILNLQRWIDVDGAKDKEYDDSGYSEQPDWELERSDDSWQFPARRAAFDAGVTPHARSFSIDSISSIPDSPLLSDTDDPRSNSKHSVSSSPFVSRYQNGISTVQSSTISESSSTDTFYAHSPTLLRAGYDGPSEAEQMHLRTTSYASTLRKPQNNSMLPKKSLPDLRSAHKDPTAKAPPLPQLSYSGVSGEHTPSLFGQDSEQTSYAHPEYIRNSDGRSHHFVAAERNLYFQRSSSNASANDSLPRPLLRLIETARSILFSMGQLHQTLDKCAQHGFFDRSSPKFRKVLDPANMTMLHLIRSLDRFDDVSQQFLPSPAVCRGLVECCRDTVTAYRRSLAPLISQIASEPSNDTRFSRWLVLELYGISIEICLAWQAMLPYLETLRPFIYSTNLSSTYSSSGTPQFQFQELKPAVRLRLIENGTGTVARGGKTRRHAGSFSSKDVEIGKELPSYDIVPSMAGGLATHTHTPTLRTPKRQITVPILSTPSHSYFPSTSSSFPPNGDYIHDRQHSQSSSQDSSSLISPTTSLDSPSSTRTFTNKDVLQPLQTAVGVAPIVWDYLEKVLGDVMISDPRIRENLDNARTATRNLSQSVADLAGEDLESDRRLLQENAYIFLKIVIQLSNILKTRGNPRYVTPALRSNMVKLANSTQEFAVMLQFPSISNLPRSNSPTSLPKFATNNSTPYPPPDNQLGSSLSRARGAQPTSLHSKQSASSMLDNLQPILPLSIKTSASRLRPAREASIEGADPG